MISGACSPSRYRLFIPLRAGGVFVAMGASHLSGPRGLLALLRQERDPHLVSGGARPIPRYQPVGSFLRIVIVRSSTAR